MRKIITLLFLSCIYVLPTYAYIDHENAVLRIMNKAAGKTQTLTVPVNRTVDFEKLGFTVRTCKQTDPFQAEDFWAFVEITRNENELIFSNWMRRNEPGDTPLQDPDYDVWLIKCE